MLFFYKIGRNDFCQILYNHILGRNPMTRFRIYHLKFFFYYSQPKLYTFKLSSYVCNAKARILFTI